MAAVPYSNLVIVSHFTIINDDDKYIICGQLVHTCQWPTVGDSLWLGNNCRSGKVLAM